jgi:hypothetical protein
VTRARGKGLVWLVRLEGLCIGELKCTQVHFSITVCVCVCAHDVSKVPYLGNIFSLHVIKRCIIGNLISHNDAKSCCDKVVAKKLMQIEIKNRSKKLTHNCSKHWSTYEKKVQSALIL